MNRTMFGAALLLCGCATNIDLYPANDEARASPPPRVTIGKHGNDNGTFTVEMSDGRILKGRYSTVGGTDTSPVTADAVGPDGLTAHCVITNNNMTNHGNGECEFSDREKYKPEHAAKYKVQY